jgi:hypothetical protein
MHKTRGYMLICTRLEAICLYAQDKRLYAYMHKTRSFMPICTRLEAICLYAQDKMLYAYMHKTRCYMLICTRPDIPPKLTSSATNRRSAMENILLLSPIAGQQWRIFPC